MTFASCSKPFVMIPRSSTRGFSLIELMIAMVIGLVFLMAVLQVMSSNSRTRNDLELSNRRMENGRYALQLLSNEIGMAGFYGEQGVTMLSDPPTGSPSPTTPCPALTNLVDHPLVELGLPVWGANTAPPTSCGTNLDFLAGNDYIVIRRASSCAVGDNDCDNFLSGAPHLQIQSCATSSPEPGEPLVSSSLSDMTAQTRACNVQAPIYRLLVRLFYIAANNQPGDGIPTLKMAELGASGYTVIPLTEGIEAMRIEYVDADGASHSAPPSNVRGVRLYLLARNTRKTSEVREVTYHLGTDVLTLSDNFRRQVLSTSILLHNLSIDNN